MAFTQGRYQPDVLRGPHWRPVPLAGIRMAGAAVDGLQLTAVLAQVPVLGGIPRLLDVLAAAGQPGRLRDTGQPTERGVMYPALRYPVGQGEFGHR
jgi:hypothetical protein